MQGLDPAQAETMLLFDVSDSACTLVKEGPIKQLARVVPLS